MKNIVLSGCSGRMGRVVTSCIAGRSDCVITAGFDVKADATTTFPVFKSPMEYMQGADALIDFSHPSLVIPVLDYAMKYRVPAVVATTGLGEAQLLKIKEASLVVPVFYSANMSVGVSLVAELARKAAALLGNSFDIEIIEKHHNQKIDAPSGTALMLANEINEELKNSKHYVYDRHAVRQKRESGEIGIHSVRGGTIVGEHEVLFAGHDETVSITHAAMSKEIFANGAVNAALFIAGKAPGLYDMKKLVQSV